MNDAKRMKELRKKLKLTQQELADAIGVKWHKIKDIEIGKSKIGVDIADKIRENFSISFDWLLTGKGSMFANKATKSDQDIEVTYYPDIYTAAGAGAQNYYPSPQTLKLSTALIQTFKIINPKRIELINIIGESMEPTFQNGDIAVVEKIDSIQEVKNGDTVIANIDGDIYIKKIEKIPFKNAIILKSTNPLYEDILIQDQELQQLHIVAIVRGKIHPI